MKTSLFNLHESMGAKMVQFSGWDMPVQYRGVLAEHQQTRNQASLFDTSHMGEIHLKGPSIEEDLEQLLTLRVGTLKPGRCRYGYLLDEKGAPLDDVILYCFSKNHYMLVVNAGTRENDVDWITGHLAKENSLEDRSLGRAKLDIQGPWSRQYIELALGITLPELPFFGFACKDIMGIEVIVSRTGYTGEWGYEFYLDAEKAPLLWNTLLEGKRIHPAGLGARDTLRLEAGLPLFGTDITRNTNPYGLFSGRFLSKEASFIGKTALNKNPEEELVGIALEGRRAARAGNEIYSEDLLIGRVTSSVFAPSLGHAIALAWVKTTHVEPLSALKINIGKKSYPAAIQDLPFYKQGTARKTT